MDSLARHDEALREWRRWQTARIPREKDKALFELWRLCGKEVQAAVKKLAAKLSESRGSPGSIGSSQWLSMHSMTYDQARWVAFTGVWRAAERFDPEKGTFQTYAYYYILHELHKEICVGDSTVDGEVRDPEALDLDKMNLRGERLLVRLAALPLGGRFQFVIKETAALSSLEVDELLEVLEEICPKEALRENMALEIVRAALLAQSVRAADREGRMAVVSDLAKMLRAKVHREHMKKKYHSNVRLGREFGVSDNTVATWLDACEEQGVGADDLSPETLDQLARIMTPRRGPRAGQRQNTSRV